MKILRTGLTGRVAATRLRARAASFGGRTRSRLGPGARGRGGGVDAIAVALATSIADGASLVAFDAAGTTGEAAAARATVFLLVGDGLQERLRGGRIRGGGGGETVGGLGGVMPEGDALGELTGVEDGERGQRNGILGMLQRVLQEAGHGGLGRVVGVRHGGHQVNSM